MRNTSNHIFIHRVGTECRYRWKSMTVSFGWPPSGNSTDMAREGDGRSDADARVMKMEENKKLEIRN